MRAVYDEVWRSRVGYLDRTDASWEYHLFDRPVRRDGQTALADPRAVVRTMFDALWVRLVDVDKALMARRYATPVDVVLDVADDVCEWNTGRWRLSAGPDGRAEVTRTDDPADLTLDVATLGAAYLGGTRLTTLAAAGRVREHRQGALSQATHAFRHDQEPCCLELF